MMYHLLSASDFGPNLDMRYYVLGNSFIYTTMFNILINTMIVIYLQFHVIRSGCRK